MHDSCQGPSVRLVPIKSRGMNGLCDYCLSEPLHRFMLYVPLYCLMRRFEEAETSAESHDDEEGRRLWALSSKLVGLPA